MEHCPVCNSQYIEGKIIYCLTCNWDLSPYITFLGEIPECYISQEKAKLDWAKKIWINSQSNLLTQEKIEKLQQENTALATSSQKYQRELAQQQLDLQSQITLMNQEKGELEKEIKQLESQISTFIIQTNDLTSQVINLQQNQSSLQKQVEQALAQKKSIERENSQLRSQVLDYTQNNERLQDIIHKLEEEKSNLELQATRTQSQLKAELERAQAKLINIEQERNQLQGRLQEIQKELDVAKEERDRLKERLTEANNEKDNIWRFS